jgi:adenylyltransferase/sulfurtransferase
MRSKTTLEGPLMLALERDLVEALDCPGCRRHDEIPRVRSCRHDADATCARCGEPALPEVLHTVEEDSPAAGRALTELGLPPYDIVRVDGACESRFVLLDAERSAHL